jgi:hypothetical protein
VALPPPDKVPGEDFFDDRAHHVLNWEEMLRREWVHDYYRSEKKPKLDETDTNSIFR